MQTLLLILGIVALATFVLARWFATAPKQCDHDPRHITYDLLEGDGNGITVQWCRQCGAYRRSSGYWRAPSLVFLLCAMLARAGDVYTVTAYCPCKVCCGPNACGLTASGVKPREGVTVAGPRSIPFGTRVLIAGVGERIVQDRLSRKYDNRFDVFFSTHEAARKFGTKRLEVTRLQ